MDDPVPLVAIVTLRKPCAEGETTITVGVSIRLGATPKPPHVPSESHSSLKTAVECSELPKDVYIKCGIAAVGGVEYVQTRHATQFDYQITVMEGRYLTDDYAIGFCLAAAKAVARAVGSSIAIEEEYGWKEA